MRIVRASCLGSLRTAIVLLIAVRTILAQDDEPIRARRVEETRPREVIAQFGAGRFRAAGQISELRFSPDGRRLATLNASACLRVWDIASGQLLRQVPGDNAFHGVPRSTFAWSANGKKLFAISEALEVKRFDGETLEERRWPNGAKPIRVPRACFLQLSEDDELLVIGDRNGGLEIRSAENGDILKTLDTTKAVALRAVFDDDGKTLSVVCHDGKRRKWNWRDGEAFEDELIPQTKHFQFQTLKTDRHGGVLLAENNQLIYAPIAGQRRQFQPHGSHSYISAVAISGNQRVLATAAGDGSVRLWSEKDSSTPLEIPRHHEAIGALALSEEGNLLATCVSQNGDRARVWKIVRGKDGAATAEELLPDDGHEAAIIHLRFSQDGTRLLSASNDNTCRVWNVETRKQVTKLDKGYHASFAADGQTILLNGLNTAEGARLIDLKNLDHPREIRRIASQGPVALSATGQRTAVLESPANGAKSTYVTVADAATGESSRSYDNGTFSAYVVRWSPNQKLLAVSGTDHTLRIWNAETNEKIELPKVDPHWIEFTSDSRQVLAMKQGRIHVFDATSGASVRELAKGVRVMSASVTPDDRRLITGCLDGQIRVWDLQSGALVNELAGHDAGVYAVAVTADGQLMATGSMDSVLLLWNLEQVGDQASRSR